MSLVRPAVRILIVTEKRQAFWPWLAWTLDNQRLPRAQRHLLVSAPNDEHAGLSDVLAPVAAKVQFVTRPHDNPSLGRLRQHLLDAVDPIIDEPVVWWDDDDWHDPARLADGLLELEDAPWVAWTQMAYCDLEGRFLGPFRVAGGIPGSTMGWHSELSKVRLPDQARAADVVWFRALQKSSVGLLCHEPAPAIVALKHKFSTNPRRLMAQVDPLWWGRLGANLRSLANRLR